ncbi:unnamed protein product [Rotaria sordida]|uniref:Uncharacterized protein n=1 Tax=Rotaria sordida TaxID=392033 RepID=A0A814SUL7_9BILA|nr:unnamed protein product [Rotaria sordida]CAF1152751.1 unnamed protein product [Rotaria sordida]CAF1243758.1 unnamed protein product [Rotaria sordida]CAF1286596.1 unnamed protein product [Rotaria sordida]
MFQSNFALYQHQSHRFYGYTGIGSYYISHSMYTVSIDQIGTNKTIQQYTLRPFQLNVSVAEYIGVGFGKTTSGSPYQLMSIMHI